MKAKLTSTFEISKDSKKKLPKMVGLVKPMKNSKIDENLEKEIIKIPRAADFDKPKEFSKTDEHLGEEIVEISCPHCREEIPQSQSIEHIEMCKQALKHISDLLLWLACQ